MAAGDYHTCALLEGGAVKCWGEGEHGALGYGSSENVGDDETPALMGAVVLGEAATQILAGPNHTCAVLASGNVRCWGLGPDAAFEFQSVGDNARPVVPHEHRIGDDELPVAWPARDLGSVYKLASGTMGTCSVEAVFGIGVQIACWASSRRQSGMAKIRTSPSVGTLTSEVRSKISLSLVDTCVRSWRRGACVVSVWLLMVPWVTETRGLWVTMSHQRWLVM